MKKYTISLLVVPVVLGIFVSLLAFAQTEVDSQNVVGFFKVDIPGAKNMILAPPMHKATVARGVVSSNTTTAIVDTNASWLVGQFDEERVTTNFSGSIFTEPGKSTFYVEISAPSNHPLVGRHFYIATSTDTALNIKDGLVAYSVNPGDLNNASYKVVPAYRMRDILGEPGQGVLKGGNSGADLTADKVRKWNSGSGWSSTMFYQTSGGTDTTLWNHWYMGSANVDDEVIDRDEAIFIERVAGTTDTNITVAGEVSGNAQTVVVDADSYAFLGGMTVIDQGISNALGSGVAGGSSGADLNAFKLRKWTPGSGWTSAMFYQTSGGTDTAYWNHWYLGSVNIDSTVSLSAGEGYLIYTPVSFVWERPSPLQ